MDNNNQNNLNNSKNNDENNNIYQMLLNKLQKNNNLNKNMNYINNINNQIDENYEDEENQNEEEYEEESNNEKKEEKNFSQQVDFLYHPNNPDNQSSIKNILIKQYKKHKNLNPEGDISKNKAQKKNIKKSKTKTNINKGKDIIPYMNKNKGLFDPYLTQKELDYESNIKKQREERQKKIAEYEKNERNKSKKKLEQDLNKKIINYKKPKVKPAINAKNYAMKKPKKNEEDLIKHFVNVPKPNIQKKMAKNFGFNPKKYDIIINSLLNEINEVKKERKKENVEFKKQIQLYSNDNVDKYNNYYEFIYKNQKLNYENQRLKSAKNLKIKKPTRGQAINNLRQKYFENNPKFTKKSDINIINGINKDNKNNNNIINDEIEKDIKLNKHIKINKNNYTKENNYTFNDKDNSDDIINGINFGNIDKLLSSENLTFQDKINILTELNKNIDNYSKNIPILVNQVKNSLEQLYENENDNNNFRKEVNKVPFIAMASKAAYQIIQTNNDIIIEKILDELLSDCAYELSNIDEKKKYLIKKQQLLNQLDSAKENIENIAKKEEDIMEQTNLYLKQKEEIKNDMNNNNDIINNNKVILMKFSAAIDDDIIGRNNKYKDDFKNYMVFKGSFYKENIFEIYDEFIEEEGENILNKAIDNYVKELHNCANQMANKEINNIMKK